MDFYTICLILTYFIFYGSISCLILIIVNLILADVFSDDMTLERPEPPPPPKPFRYIEKRPKHQPMCVKKKFLYVYTYRNEKIELDEFECPVSGKEMEVDGVFKQHLEHLKLMSVKFSSDIHKDHPIELLDWSDHKMQKDIKKLFKHVKIFPFFTALTSDKYFFYIHVTVVTQEHLEFIKHKFLGKYTIRLVSMCKTPELITRII